MATRPILYYGLFSPPSRACLLTSKLIGLDLELKTVDFVNKEHHSEWFLKINPRHTVPVMIDQGTSICDSHAILTYMISKYGQTDHEYLYPKDLLKRALVDERLFFESSVLVQVIKDFVGKILYGGEICYNPTTLQFCHTAYAFLEEFLTRTSFAAGDQMSVADISINTTLVTLHKLVPIKAKRYPKIYAWMQLLRKELPDFAEINEAGAELLYKRFEEALENNMTRS